MNKKPRLALSPLLLAPIFLGFTLNGWRIRILPPNGAQSTHAFAAPGGSLPDFEKGADGRSAYFRRKTLGGSGVPCLPCRRKRTNWQRLAKSALCHFRIRAPQQKICAVLDYSVTSSARAQGWRDFELERLGSLEVDG
jgi:hypothetical protein